MKILYSGDETEAVLEKNRKRIKLSELENGLEVVNETLLKNRKLKDVECSENLKIIIKSIIDNGYSTLSERELYLKHVEMRIPFENQIKIKEEEIKEIRKSFIRADPFKDEYKYDDKKENIFYDMALTFKGYELVKIIKENENKFYNLSLTDILKRVLNIGEPINPEISDLFKDDKGEFLSKESLRDKKTKIANDAFNLFPLGYDYNVNHEDILSQILKFKKILKESNANNKDSPFQVTDENIAIYIEYMVASEERKRTKIKEFKDDISDLNKQISSLNEVSGLSKDLEKKIDCEIQLALMATRHEYLNEKVYYQYSDIEKIHHKNFKVDEVKEKEKIEQETEKQKKEDAILKKQVKFISKIAKKNVKRKKIS